ncbi:MAG: cyclic pyranopterin monophosphate synthase MoaC [Thermovirgaceae bacterium]|nr:cyclic pyranopterin monophosphate synthase MoaC [Thermovirgaceae bacterium]
MAGFSHIDDSGRPIMVDVGGKSSTLREAVAEGIVRLPESVKEAILSGKTVKGDVLKVAEIAGIMGCKRTPELIPLCHPIRLDNVSILCEMDAGKNLVRIICKVRSNDVTGVEMEALTGVSIAALTLYDMCKGIDKGVLIENIRLLSKSGGKSGDYITGDDR